MSEVQLTEFLQVAMHLSKHVRRLPSRVGGKKLHQVYLLSDGHRSILTLVRALIALFMQSKCLIWTRAVSCSV